MNKNFYTNIVVRAKPFLLFMHNKSQCLYLKAVLVLGNKLVDKSKSNMNLVRTLETWINVQHLLEPLNCPEKKKKKFLIDRIVIMSPLLI